MRALQSFRFAFDRDPANGVLPFNPATSEFNPIAPKLAMAVDGNKLVTHCEFSNCYESGPDTVQRGRVAAVYDQLLAYAVMASGRTGPTPINRRLRFECAVASIDGRKARSPEAAITETRSAARPRPCCWRPIRSK